MKAYIKFKNNDIATVDGADLTITRNPLTGDVHILDGERCIFVTDFDNVHHIGIDEGEKKRG